MKSFARIAALLLRKSSLESHVSTGGSVSDRRNVPKGGTKNHASAINKSGAVPIGLHDGALRRPRLHGETDYAVLFFCSFLGALRFATVKGLDV